MTLTVYFDGACEWHTWADGSKHRNPGGIATYGWLIYQDEVKIANGYGEVCRGSGATNNKAEYMALIKSLEAVKDLALEHDLEYDYIEVRGDSQLVIRQLMGVYAVNSDNLRDLYEQAKKLVRKAKGILQWIPREQNQEADDLSKLAYDIARREGDRGPWDKRFKVAAAQPD